MKNGIFVPYEDSRLHYLLTVQPNDWCNAVDFWSQVVRNLLLEGNAYIIPFYDMTPPFEYSRLVLCNPGTVSHDTLADTYMVADAISGVQGLYSERDIIHIKNYSRDGKTGLSTLAFARTAITIAAVGDSEAYDRFKNGGNVRGIVGNDTSVRGFGEYQDKELERAAADIDDRFRSGERIIAIPGQATFKPLSLSSVDLQFLESRKFTIREICRFFNVPPSMAFDDSATNYKSAELENTAFLCNSLEPILKRIESELQRKLIPAALCDRRKIIFDRRALMAADLESKANYQAQTIAAGIYTVNEWRREENKAPVKGGDTPLVSANLKPLSELSGTAAGADGEE
jgi:HK97 family phage portal protein